MSPICWIAHKKIVTVLTLWKVDLREEPEKSCYILLASAMTIFGVAASWICRTQIRHLGRHRPATWTCWPNRCNRHACCRGWSCGQRIFSGSGDDFGPQLWRWVWRIEHSEGKPSRERSDGYVSKRRHGWIVTEGPKRVIEFACRTKFAVSTCKVHARRCALQKKQLISSGSQANCRHATSRALSTMTSTSSDVNRMANTQYISQMQLDRNLQEQKVRDD